MEKILLFVLNANWEINEEIEFFDKAFKKYVDFKTKLIDN